MPFSDRQWISSVGHFDAYPIRSHSGDGRPDLGILAIEEHSAPCGWIATLGALWSGTQQIPTKSGLDFENANRIASISFNFFPNGHLRSTYSRLSNVAGFRPIYSKIKNNFFVTATQGDGVNAYSRYQAIPSGITQRMPFCMANASPPLCQIYFERISS
jgi:hypothetical protein